jgi:deoxyribonuclease IV
MPQLLRFAPAGIPISTPSPGGTLEGVRYCRQIRLGAMEVEFVQGVRMKDELAKTIGREAASVDVSLSCHGPYFVNLCSSDAKVIANTKRHFLSCAQAAHHLRASPIVFHPGFYQGMPKDEAAKKAKRLLQEILHEIELQGFDDVAIGTELTGKKSAYGDLDEIIDLAQAFGVKKVQPVVDFGHYHARIGRLKSEDDYAKIFDAIEKGLGADALEKFHCHFSEISFTSSGEYKHLPLADGMVKMDAKKEGVGAGGPPFGPLAKLLRERGYSGTIVCESPLLEKDALKLQEIFRSA